MKRRNINNTPKVAVVTVLAGVMLVGCAGEPVMQTEVRPVYRVQGEAEATGSAYEAGVAHFTQARYGLALDAFQKELARHPHSVKVLNGIAACYDRLGRFDVAMQYYHQALDVAPRSAQTLNNIGYSLLLQGDRAKAARYFDQALQVQPENAHAQANQALLKDQLAKPESTPLAATSPMAVRPVETPAPKVHPMQEKAEAAAPASATPTAASAPAPAMPATASAPAQAEDGPPMTLEISNGNGRTGMAALVREVMRGKFGERVPHITNADRFTYAKTLIIHRPEARAMAQRLAERLQVDAEFREVPEGPGRTDVKVILGRDVLPHEANLKAQAGEGAGR